VRTRNFTLALNLISVLVFGLAGLNGCADPDGGGPVEPYAAPDFSLPDFNPYSSTWNDLRSPSEEGGKVLVVYFASFS
jgi:hypothetical protein